MGERNVEKGLLDQISQRKDCSARFIWKEGMQMLMNKVKQFIRETDGPTATEYAVMLALIIVVCLVAISTLGTKVSSIFSAVDATLVVPGSAS